MRLIAPTATPWLSATWGTVIPYFTKDWMRANCDVGISGVGSCSELTGVFRSSVRSGGAGEILSTRGLRADRLPGCRDAGTDGSLTGCFAVNSASAA
jgi:hypothetical protein